MSATRAAALLFVSLALVTAGCGNDGPSSPDKSCFAVAGSKGTVTGSVSGLSSSSFSGKVGTGGAQVAGSLFTVNALDTTDGTGIVFSAPASVVANLTVPGAVNSPGAGYTITVQTRSCTAGTGSWIAGLGFGTATLTVKTYSATGATGTITGTLQPGPGSVGTKTINVDFSVTF